MVEIICNFKVDLVPAKYHKTNSILDKIRKQDIAVGLTII
ncbi:MAG: hypothetical protein ACJAQX_002184 [Polaribacter sp.]|jgi:hypothetical protein